MSQIAYTLRNLSRRQKLLIIISFDFLIALSCWIVFGPPAAQMIATDFSLSLSKIIVDNIASFLIPLTLTFIYFISSGFYRSLLKFFDSKNSIFTALTGSFIFGFSWGIVYLSQYEIIRTSYLSTVILQSFLLSSVFYAFLQIGRDIARLFIYPSKIRLNGRPILIYGAGSAGNELYQSIKLDRNANVIGFYDDSWKLRGGEINNLKIYGKDKHIKRLSARYPNLEIYLAIPSLNVAERRKIISSLEKYRVAVRSMPSIHEIIADEKKMSEIQDLSIDDILPRETVGISKISFTEKTVLITGAGGSIGSEIVRQVIQGNPRKIVLYELSEINIYSIQSEAEALKKSKNFNTEIIAVLGDVKDKSRLEYIISNHKVDSIYHAAAYKHVPIVEYFENVSEGVKNNILGTKAVCEAAVSCNVEKVVVISTDKAVRPTNVMGASKRFAEMVVQSIDASSHGTTFCMVRFGNVLNSSGSVIPLFRKQIANGGPITITSKDVTRFFMTISEASSLVIQAGEYASGGDVFILDMGEQVKIMDLAERLVYLSGRNIKKENIGEGIEIREVGLRPGEKLYEELLISGEEISTPNSKIFKSLESYPKADVLEGALSDLIKYASLNDSAAIKRVLKAHVEGYKEAKNL